MLKIIGSAVTHSPIVTIELVMHPNTAPNKIEQGLLVVSIPVKLEDNSDGEVRFGFSPRGDIFYGVCRRPNEQGRYLTFVHDVAYKHAGLSSAAYINLFNLDFCDDVHTELKIREQIIDAFKEASKERFL